MSAIPRARARSFARATGAVALAAALLWATGARAQDCAVDPALAEAAAELLASPTRPDAGALREAARRAGADTPQLVAHVRRDGDDEGRRAFVATSRVRFAAPLACGEASSEGRALLLVGPAAGHLEAIGEDRVRVDVIDGWRSPRIEVVDREGRAWRRDVRRGEEVGLPSDLSLPLTVQLLAEGPNGPRPIAERRIGAPIPMLVLDTDEPLARRLAHLREASGVGAVRANRLLARVAVRHAEQSCRERRVAHVVPDGDPEERLAREGIEARHVGETIARADDPAAAYAAMLRSPSHRAALTDPRFTDAGVGVAEGGAARACVVILLASWPRAVPYTAR